MQRNRHLQESSSGWNHDFDMWHDYMNLGRTLQQLSDIAQPSQNTCNTLNTCLPQMDNTETGIKAHKWLSLDSIDSHTSSVSDNTNCTLTSVDYCGFCKQNGETASIYRNHKLKSKDGKVTCPILRSYTCPMCGASGDNAHTRRYCPQQNCSMLKY